MNTIIVAIVGAGRGGLGLLRLFFENPAVEVRCIIDTDPHAPGLAQAEAKGIAVYNHVRHLESLDDVDLIVNVTGNEAINQEIALYAKDPSRIVNGQISNIIYTLMIETTNLNNELSRTGRYLKNIIDNSRDMIITTDPEGCIVRFNRGGEQMLGYSEEEMRGRNIGEIYADPEDRRRALELMEENGYISNYITTLMARNGRIVNISLTLTPLYDENGEYMGTVGVSKDITQQLKNEALIREKNRQLEDLTENLEELVRKRTWELEKVNERLITLNKYKSQFIANMSHELRTPLNSIIGFSEILVDGTFGEMNPKQLKYATNINRSGNHLLQIINDILDLAKIDAGKMELHTTRFDLNELIRDSLYMFESGAAKKGLRLQLKLVDAKVSVLADQGKIKQVLFNLINNAIKFTRQGGEVRVETSLQDGQVFVDVEDTGVGIPPEDQERIFQEFEQVDNSYSREYEGTGLGLPLVKKFLEMHQTDITVKSVPDVGSTFRFSLKLLESAGGAVLQGRGRDGRGEIKSVPAAEGGDETADHGSEKSSAVVDAPLILVVEDDRDALELMTLFLSREGFRTAHAYDGKEAVQKAMQLRPSAITLDIMLPNMDGWEVIQVLKGDEKTRDIPIIITSMTDNRELGFSLGAVEFLTKPVDKSRMRYVLNEIISRYYSEKQKISILAVDDQDENLLLMRDILSMLDREFRLEIRTASGGMEALTSVVAKKPDLLILDLMMPEVSGFDVIRQLKKDPATASVPIIILTAMNLTPEEREFLEHETQRIFLKTEMKIGNFLEEIRRVVPHVVFPEGAGSSSSPLPESRRG